MILKHVYTSKYNKDFKIGFKDTANLLRHVKYVYNVNNTRNEPKRVHVVRNDFDSDMPESICDQIAEMQGNTKYLMYQFAFSIMRKDYPLYAKYFNNIADEVIGEGRGYFVIHDPMGKDTIDGHIGLSATNPLTGKAIRMGNVPMRLRNICEKYERICGGTMTGKNAPLRELEPTYNSREVAFIKRTGKMSNSVMLKTHVIEAINSSQDLEALNANLSKHNISYNLRKDGEKIVGISFSDLSGTYCTGKSIRFPFGKLAAKFKFYDNERNNRPSTPSHATSRDHPKIDATERNYRTAATDTRTPSPSNGNNPRKREIDFQRIIAGVGKTPVNNNYAALAWLIEMIIMKMLKPTPAVTPKPIYRPIESILTQRQHRSHSQHYDRPYRPPNRPGMDL